jgi:hypothetical protein
MEERTELKFATEILMSFVWVNSSSKYRCLGTHNAKLRVLLRTESRQITRLPAPRIAIPISSTEEKLPMRLSSCNATTKRIGNGK